MQKFNYIGVLTLFKKENKRFREVWKQTVLAPVINNVLYLFIFGAALATRGAFFEGYNYLQGLIPGLVAMGLMMNAFQNPTFSLILAKYTNIISELLMIPLRGFEIMLAYLGSALFRGVLVGAATYLVGLLFTPIPIHQPVWLLVFTILLGGIFSSLGALMGIVADDFDQVGSVQSFIVQPLIFLGGVFIPLTVIPEKFVVLAKLNPIVYLVDGFRYGFLGTGTFSIWTSFTVTLLMFVICFSAVSYVFSSGYKLKT